MYRIAVQTKNRTAVYMIAAHDFASVAVRHKGVVSDVNEWRSGRDYNLEDVLSFFEWLAEALEPPVRLVA